MMAKVKITLLCIAAILSPINGHPLLEEESSTATSDAKSHELQVNPLVAGRKGEENVKEPSSTNDTSKHNDSAEQTVLEETYIEVLLPGSPQVNSSILEALFNSSSATKPQENARAKRDQSFDYSATVQPSPSSTSKPFIVPALYGEHQDSQQQEHEETNSSQQKTSDSRTVRDTLAAKNDHDHQKATVKPVLYSQNNGHQPQSNNSPAVHPEQTRATRDTNSAQQEIPNSPTATVKPVLYSQNNGHQPQSNNSPAAVVPAVHAQHTRATRDSSDEDHDDKDGHSGEDSSASKETQPAPGDGDAVRPSVYSSRSERGSSSEEHDSSEESNGRGPQSSSSGSRRPQDDSD